MNQLYLARFIRKRKCLLKETASAYNESWWGLFSLARTSSVRLPRESGTGKGEEKICNGNHVLVDITHVYTSSQKED